jgi:hypothetical protein
LTYGIAAKGGMEAQAETGVQVDCWPPEFNLATQTAMLRSSMLTVGPGPARRITGPKSQRAPADALKRDALLVLRVREKPSSKKLTSERVYKKLLDKRNKQVICIILGTTRCPKHHERAALRLLRRR